MRIARPWTLDLVLYEVTNTTDGKWSDAEAGRDVRGTVWKMDLAGRMVRLDRNLIETAARLARAHSITSYDAAYVAAAERLRMPLVSCDVRDLVSKGLAVTPTVMLERLRAEADAPADDQ